MLRFLGVMACGEESASRDLAVLVLSEWWTPDAIPKALDD